jgi:hypothetical protein
MCENKQNLYGNYFYLLFTHFNCFQQKVGETRSMFLN